MMKNKLVIICGPSASGKTTLVNKLITKLDCATLSVDNYYKAQDYLSFEEREAINYDHPQQIDFDLMYANVRALLNGEDIVAPFYDFKVHNRSDKIIHIKSKPIIILEGIFSLYDLRIATLSSYNIFINCNEETLIERRISRDISMRQRTKEYCLNQYLTYTKPMYEQYILPSIKNINFTINSNNGIDDKEVMNLLKELETLKIEK